MVKTNTKLIRKVTSSTVRCQTSTKFKKLMQTNDNQPLKHRILRKRRL